MGLTTTDLTRSDGETEVRRAGIYTFSGRSVDLFALRPEDLEPGVIAHHLALCNRFAGATREPYSVAQHSVYAARLAAHWGEEAAAQLQALLHDASEAFLGDVTKWLKQTPEMAAYQAVEERAQSLIYETYALPAEDLPCVKRADKLLVRYEMLMALPAGCTVVGICPEHAATYPDLTEADVAEVERACRPFAFWSWQRAEYAFRLTYDRLVERIANRVE